MTGTVMIHVSVSSRDAANESGTEPRSGPDDPQGKGTDDRAANAPYRNWRKDTAWIASKQRISPRKTLPNRDTIPAMSGFGDPNVYQPRAPMNPRLLKALSSSVTDATARHGFYEALMNSVLLVPTQTITSDVSPIGGDKKFLLVEDEKGVPAVCAFTDLAAMQRWQPGSKGFLSLPTPQFLRESFPAAAGGIWINIADRAARFVSRLELAQVTSGLICASYTQQVEKELTPLHADFEPRLPGSLPTELLSRIVQTVQREPDVGSAYVMEIDPMPKRKRLCVGLRLGRLLEEAQVDQLLRRVARQINVRRLHRGTIDVILLDFARHRIVAKTIPATFERV